MALSLTPIEKLDLAIHYIPPHPTRRIPNSPPHSHPLLIYRSAYDSTTPPAQIEMHLQTKRIVPQWRYTMYKTSHFHSTSHEVLCVYSGRALLLFGGDEHPDGVQVEVKAGDTVVVPAGVAHRLLEDKSTWKDVGGEHIEDWVGGFLMVGGYPQGCHWDMCYGNEEEDDKCEAVKRVEWLATDPLYGDEGPAMWEDDTLKDYALTYYAEPAPRCQTCGR